LHPPQVQHWKLFVSALFDTAGANQFIECTLKEFALPQRCAAVEDTAFDTRRVRSASVIGFGDLLQKCSRKAIYGVLCCGHGSFLSFCFQLINETL
jgi:hypothetical protein